MMRLWLVVALVIDICLWYTMPFWLWSVWTMYVAFLATAVAKRE